MPAVVLPSISRAGQAARCSSVARGQRPLVRVVRRALVSLAITGLSGAAMAQDQAARPLTADDDPVVLLKPLQVRGLAGQGTTEGSSSYTTESMRSATGLDLSIRETPQAVSVVTRQAIEDQGFLTTAEAMASAPGISSLNSDSNRLSLSARGFTIDSVQFDGLTHPIQSQWNFGDTDLDIAFYDRVEVVRGATGLMKGAGSPSAAINFVRKRPRPDAYAAVAVSAGRWDLRRTEADVSTPLNGDGSVRGRLVAAYTEQDSYIAFVESEKKAVYGVVVADLAPRTWLSVGVEYQDSDSDGMGSGFPLFYHDGSRTDFSRAVANNAPWSRMDTESATGFFDLEHGFAGGWKLRAAFSYNDGNYVMKHVYRGGYPNRVTGLGMTGTAFNNYRGDRTRRDLHVAASGPFDLFGRGHEASLGWMRIEDEVDMRRRLPAGTPPAIGSFFDWRTGAIAEPVWSAQADRVDVLDNRQDGAYAVARFSLADPLTLILGARLSRWETDQNYFGSLRKYRYSDELTPYAGLVYDIDDTYSAYASFTGIFTPQNARDPSGSILDPVTGENYEIGLKAAYLEGRVNAALVAFDMRQDNLAQALPGQTVIGLPGTQAYRAAKGAEVKGYEFELAGELAANWNLSASFTWFEAEDATGQRINTTHPGSMAKLFTTYRFGGALEALTVGGGIHWQNRIYSNAPSPVGTQRVAQADYALVNLMARYRINRRLQLSLNIDNVLDKQYYNQIGFFSQGWWGEPRNTVIGLRYAF